VIIPAALGAPKPVLGFDFIVESCGYKKVECASKRVAPFEIRVLIGHAEGLFDQQTWQAVRGWRDS
jgi:hypothetical protein